MLLLRRFSLQDHSVTFATKNHSSIGDSLPEGYRNHHCPNQEQPMLFFVRDKRTNWDHILVIVSFRASPSLLENQEP
jgi:hypothetical protein